MSVRSDNELTQYCLFDKDGNTYTQDQFNEIPDSPDAGELGDVLDEIQSTHGQSQRLALAHLAKIATTHPAESTETVSVTTEFLTKAAPAIQGEALGILTTIAEAKPEAVRPALNSAISLLSDDTHPLLRNEALEFLAAVAKHDTESVVDTVPRLSELLHDGPTDSEPIARILAQVAHSHPDALLPVVTKLELYLEAEPDAAHISVLAAIGHLTERYPTVAKETIPTATELQR